MRFRDSIALHTCPLLLRVGLAAAFLWAGIPKWGNETFEGPAAATLVELGIGHKTVVAGGPVTPPAKVEESKKPDSAPVVEPPAPEDSPDSAQPTEEQPSSNTQPPADGEGDDQPEQARPAEQPTTQPAEQPAQAPAKPDTKSAPPATKPVVEKSSGAPVQYKVDAKKVEGLTIMLHNVGHPYPRIFAWIAMFTETIGAGLLLIGLFSRVWGLGLAVAMGYAFALTTLPTVQANMDPSAGNAVWQFLSSLRGAEPLTQCAAMLQVTLLIAAWCIFIGGPGAVSLDRLIFRGGRNDED